MGTKEKNRKRVGVTDRRIKKKDKESGVEDETEAERGTINEREREWKRRIRLKERDGRQRSSKRKFSFLERLGHKD